MSSLLVDMDTLSYIFDIIFLHMVHETVEIHLKICLKRTFYFMACFHGVVSFFYENIQLL